jgi:hypothetical protein
LRGRGDPDHAARQERLPLTPTPLHSDVDIGALVVALSDVWTRPTLCRVA